MIRPSQCPECGGRLGPPPGVLDLNAARTYCVACSAYAEDLLDEAGDLELDPPPPPTFHRLGNQSDGERPMRGDDV